MDPWTTARLEWARQCMAPAVASMQLAEAASRERHHLGSFTHDPRGWFHREAKLHRGREVLADALGRAGACADLDDGAPNAEADSMAFMVALAASAVWALAVDSCRAPCTAEAFWAGLRRETRWQEETLALWTRTIVGLDEIKEVHQ